MNSTPLSNERYIEVGTTMATVRYQPMLSSTNERYIEVGTTMAMVRYQPMLSSTTDRYTGCNAS